MPLGFVKTNFEDYFSFQHPIEASWMLYQIMALLHAVALMETMVLSSGIRSYANGARSNGFLVAQGSGVLFDQRSVINRRAGVRRLRVHRTMEAFFESRRPPSSFSRIPIADAVPPRFELLKDRTMDGMERVVKRALSQCREWTGLFELRQARRKSPSRVQGQRRIVVADMVSAPSPGDTISDVSKGIRRYSSVGEGSVDALCSDDQLRSLKVEEWHPVIFGFEET
ncbi:hypothetical protein B0H13DRAFT_1913262 [Mycena leptocephala]|nr:hypothetical protein B0H13DRAFT_1913262 [Mycena leptocephala]